jgi:hypothetical protein
MRQNFKLAIKAEQNENFICYKCREPCQLRDKLKELKHSSSVKEEIWHLGRQTIENCDSKIKITKWVKLFPVAHLF